MSELAPILRDSAAIAWAERRLWLLDLMLRLCAALLAVVMSDRSSLPFLQWARDEACAPLARATGMVQRLKTETERQLRILQADVAREPEPARRTNAVRPAQRIERAVAPIRAPREAPATDEAGAAFRARLEALEAFLDQQGPLAALPAHDVAGRLCGVLGLSPDWIRWLDDHWLTANLDLSRPLSPPAGASAPLALPPPPHPSPPDLPAEASFARPDNRQLLETYIPGFKEALGKRMFDAIDLFATSKDEFAFLCGILKQRLATNEPYMWGGYIPLRGAVNRLCGKLRLWPDWTLWRDDDWIDDGLPRYSVPSGGAALPN